MVSMNLDQFQQNTASIFTRLRQSQGKVMIWTGYVCVCVCMYACIFICSLIAPHLLIITGGMRYRLKRLDRPLVMTCH